MHQTSGWRIGLNTPWALAISLGGLYEAWAGARLGFEHNAGTSKADAEDITFSADGLRSGLFLGFGVGFRRVHALVELSADLEYWDLRRDGANSSALGLSLTPAFALRLRI